MKCNRQKITKWKTDINIHYTQINKDSKLSVEITPESYIKQICA